MKTVTELYDQLDQQLNTISFETSDVLESTKLSYRAVEAAMSQLKAYIIAYDFKDIQEEIYFFKELKPRFYARLIYFIRLFDIETNRPDGSKGAQAKYLKKHLAAIKRYCQDNMTFYKYYRSGATYLDNVYFTRDKYDLLIGIDVSYFDCDQHFCTSHDYKAATLLANEQLAAYLSNSLSRLNGNLADSKMSMLDELGLRWAETKVSFVELLYALHSVGAFYNTKTQSKADVKDIAKFFEITLNINPGNIYRVFYDIRLRKKEPIPFIKKMDSELINYISQVND
jgi:hypothetical protein